MVGNPRIEELVERGRSEVDPDKPPLDLPPGEGLIARDAL
jgi:hypothetical protein